ncbi:MAG: TIM barrel protein [Candidatus Woesearchaeota archaeon]
MFGIKVKNLFAEKTKLLLLKNNLLNTNFLIEKTGNEVIFPIKTDSIELLKKIMEGSKIGFQMLEKEFAEKKKNYKELLEEEFGEKAEKIKRAFEIVGDILITEIPREMECFEKKIGEILLKSNPGIKTVLKKAGAHEGEFRVQKYKLLAGIDKRETIYVENNCRFMLDIERVYFSTKLSTERLRIARMVSKEEDVLVMFSGYGAYPITILKHSNPRRVYAVELNEQAHKYALINKNLNKVSDEKLILIQGDVRTEVPRLLELRKPTIGLKSHWNSKELKVRLKKRPKVVEFYLRPGDLENKKEEIGNRIKTLGKSGIRVMLHQPFIFNGKPVSLSNEELVENSKECYKKLLELCLNENVLGFVVHPYRAANKRETKREVFLKEMKELLSNEAFRKYVFLENIHSGFFSKPQGIKSLLLELNIKNVCFDLAHFYIANKNQDLMIKTIKELKEHFNVYFHIADTGGKLRGKDKSIDTLDFGKGKLDFEKLMEIIGFGVVEVYSKDELEAKEMLNTFESIQKIISEKSKFSRIAMPLPKTGKNFLDLAFRAIRKNGIIHFYTFLEKGEIPKKGYEIIEREASKQNKKIVFKEYVVCGQISPRKYRVCFDFQVV